MEMIVQGGGRTAAPDPAAERGEREAAVRREAGALASFADGLGRLAQAAASPEAPGVVSTAARWTERAFAPDDPVGPGLLGWLDGLRQDAASRQGLAAYGRALEAVAGLPLPPALRRMAGDAVTRRAQTGGLLPEAPWVQGLARSHLTLKTAAAAIGRAKEPGEAPAILAGLETDADLLPEDRAFLEREVRRRDGAAVARHRGRLAGKEAEDRAAFARGEAVQPMSEAGFAQLYGPATWEARWQDYRRAQEQGRATALILGQDAAGIEAARTRWDGAPEVFAAAVAADAARREADPVAYLFAARPEVAQAYAETEDPAARQWQLCQAQHEAGLAGEGCLLWTAAERAALADAWDALPPGHAGRNERLAFFREHVLAYPADLRPHAIRTLIGQGIVEGTEAEVAALVADLEAGRNNRARQIAVALTVPVQGDEKRRGGVGAGPSRSQQAQPDAQRPPLGPYLASEIGEDALPLPSLAFDDAHQRSDPAFGGFTPGHAGTLSELKEVALPRPQALPNGAIGSPREGQIVATRLENLLADDHDLRAFALDDLRALFSEAPETLSWVDDVRRALTPQGSDMLSREDAVRVIETVATSARAGVLPDGETWTQALETWTDLRTIVSDGPTFGFPLAARMLQHFMEGGGTPIKIPAETLRSYETIDEAQERLRFHFENWMVQPEGEGQQGLERIERDLLSLGEGDSLHRASHWDASFNRSTIGNKLSEALGIALTDFFPFILKRLGVPNTDLPRLIDPENRKELDLFGALGAAQLGGDGAFVFTREGDEIRFEGAIDVLLADIYDYNENDRFFLIVAAKWYWLSADEINATKPFFGSRDFSVSSAWRRTVRGTLRVRKNEQRLELEIFQWLD